MPNMLSKMVSKAYVIAYTNLHRNHYVKQIANTWVIIVMLIVVVAVGRAIQTSHQLYMNMYRIPRPVIGELLTCIELLDDDNN